MKRLLHINSPIDTKKGLEESPPRPSFSNPLFQLIACAHRRLFFWRQALHERFPPGTKARMPMPETGQQRFRIRIVPFP